MKISRGLIEPELMIFPDAGASSTPGETGGGGVGGRRRTWAVPPRDRNMFFAMRNILPPGPKTGLQFSYWKELLPTLTLSFGLFIFFFLFNSLQRVTSGPP